MMSLPFLTAAIAMAIGWSGWRSGAAWLTVLAVAIALALFAVHATSSLDIDL